MADFEIKGIGEGEQVMLQIIEQFVDRKTGWFGY
jgi:hypothetical protein